MYAWALLFLHKTKVEISLMKKILLKANVSNAFADDRLTSQQVQVHVIYIQSTNNHRFSGCSVHALPPWGPCVRFYNQCRPRVKPRISLVVWERNVFQKLFLTCDCGELLWCTSRQLWELPASNPSICLWLKIFLAKLSLGRATHVFFINLTCL